MNKHPHIFNALPGCYLILLPNAPEFRIIDVNTAYLNATQTTREIIGKPMFQVFPDNPQNPNATGVRNLTASLHKVIETRQPHEMAIQRYDTRQPGNDSFSIRYWKPINIPVLGADGAIECIIHAVEDVTGIMVLREDLKNQDHRNQQQIKDAVVSTQEMERAEISQELHDNINQILNTARLYVEKSIHTPDEEQNFLKLGHALIEKAIEEVKSLSKALIGASKEEKQLNHALEEVLEQVMSLKDINISKRIELPDETLIESKVKTTIIRILQEQLTNVVKHANAQNLYIAIHFKDNQLELTIKDDGKGFDVQTVTPGLGFHNIKSRVALLQGQAFITSVPGDGCEIHVRLPVKERS